MPVVVSDTSPLRALAHYLATSTMLDRACTR